MEGWEDERGWRGGRMRGCGGVGGRMRGCGGVGG